MDSRDQEILNQLEELKKKNPFKVPEGYLENLTDNIMSCLPEKVPVQEPKVTLYDKISPWLYLAAAFIGIVLLLKGVASLDISSKNGSNKTDGIRSEVVQSEKSSDDEYLEYLEDRYTSYAMAEVRANYE